MQSGLHGALVRALEGFWVIQIGQTPPFAHHSSPTSSPRWWLISPPPHYTNLSRQTSAWLINPERLMQDGQFVRNQYTISQGVDWYGRLTADHFYRHVRPETE
jgi:hypothetical protein